MEKGLDPSRRFSTYMYQEKLSLLKAERRGIDFFATEKYLAVSLSLKRRLHKSGLMFFSLCCTVQCSVRFYLLKK